MLISLTEDLGRNVVRIRLTMLLVPNFVLQSEATAQHLRHDGTEE